MPTARTPLLASSRRSGESERSDERAEEEDEALRSDADVRPPPGARRVRLRELLLFIWALVATAAVVVLAVVAQHQRQTGSWEKRPAAKRNLVFMVSDGMGPASLALTRTFRQLTEGLPIDDTLVLDRHFWGTSRTRSSNRLVTDSAAGATAFSCGMKSYNGAIATLPDFSPCGTVLEAAKRAGYLTGMVATTSVTDATLSAFASHAKLRTQNDEIALQEVGEHPLGRVLDLLLGGGRCYFLPNSTGQSGGGHSSCRQDAVDVTEVAAQHGWTYLDDRAGFDSLRGGENASLPVLGLFADSDFPFELDRRNMADVYPSLSEMASAALRALERATAGSDKGFFLMIEGSRIDHAGHTNDPAAQVHEVLEYDKTFGTVLDFIERSDAEGVLVATSDHETGGLATAWQVPGHLPVYNWYPSALAKASASAEHLASLLRSHINSLSDSSGPGAADAESLRGWINTNLVVGGLGITDGRDDELDLLASRPGSADTIFASMISERAHIGWSTHGHSAVDVNIYSSGGPGTEKLRGNVENTEIGKFLRTYLDVDVDEITRELKEKRAVQQVDREVEADDT